MITSRGPILDAPEEPRNRLPATITSADITADQRAPNVVPSLIADLGDEAAWRYVEFFTANIRHPHTRRAYARACARFFAWCEDRGLMPAAIRPHDVATYIEQLQDAVSAPSVNENGGGKVCHGSGGIVPLLAEEKSATFSLPFSREGGGIFTLALYL